MMNGFDFNSFRNTLSGGARELALACKFESIDGGALRLSIGAKDTPLLVFSKRFREEVGIEESELRIIISIRSSKA